MNVADFHCDLLSYLERGEGRSVNDPESRASVPLLEAGGVVLQTMAIFSKTTPDSVRCGSEQFKIYFDVVRKQKIKTILAVENASNFCGEDEDLEVGLKRIEEWSSKTPIAYISLTWNDENRFGGGNTTKIGIKPDGQELLRWMSGKKIAIDLSHTSDQLAHDILAMIDRDKLDITPVASHSNFRSVVDLPRNLTDEIALEIGRRGGLIGLNFVRSFLKDFILQVEHAEKLGLLGHFCFGADFFEEHDVPPELSYLKPFFFEGFDTSACYPKVIERLLTRFSRDVIEKIAYKNLIRFLGFA